MVLKKIQLNGFKSFADKIEIGFGGGITAIVGPNGCGKSNVADAIKWVLGEQSHKAVRGNSMQDVIFKGTEARKMQSYCEVGLFFDNRNRIFPIDEAEVALSRKLFRDGESEYAVNGQPTRLKDITNLLHDSGIDRDGLTIIGQGQVENLVNAKPEARRGIFEEAAGISKFRARRDEAERKLEKTSAELTRVGDVIGEIERNLEPLLHQAEKAKKYLELKEQLKQLEINLFVHKYDTAEEEKNKLQIEIDGYVKELKQCQKALAAVDKASGAGMDKLSLLDGQITALRDKILLLSVDTEKQTGQQLLYDATMDIIRQAELRKAELLSKRQMIKNIIDSGEGFKYSVKKLIEEKNKNSAVASAIVGVVSRELTVPAHLETAIEIALGAAAQNIITHNEEDAKTLVKTLAAKNLGRATFLPITSVKPREVTSAERNMLKSMGSRVIWIAAELVKYRAEIAGVISNLLGRVIITDNLDSAIALSRNAGYVFKAVTLDGDVIETRGSITGGSKNAVSNVIWHTNNMNQIEKELLEVDEKIRAAKQKAAAIPKFQAESKHQNQLDELKKKLLLLTAERDNVHCMTGTGISERKDLTEKINEQQVKYYYADNLLQRVDIEIENLSQRILEEYGLNYSACYKQKDENFNVLSAMPEIEALKKEIGRLGNINLDAIEQVKIDKERYDSYKMQVQDLVSAKIDLEKVIAELNVQMGTDFKNAFVQINKNFTEIFHELFGGGAAKLVLTDDAKRINAGEAAKTEANFLDCGIDIIAEPPGKKLANLSLLSGGEKALTAIAILFAILKLKPMPFCLLDEIEAALDDVNVLRFANYLDNFSAETQFIVITHRKPTMEFADILYGVTMEQKGISKIVSVKLTGHETV
jgi:chromosome segregation protein